MATPYKWFISYTTPKGKKRTEQWLRKPPGAYKGRYIKRFTNMGTSLIPLRRKK